MDPRAARLGREHRGAALLCAPRAARSSAIRTSTRCTRRRAGSTCDLATRQWMFDADDLYRANSAIFSRAKLSTIGAIHEIVQAVFPNASRRCASVLSKQARHPSFFSATISPRASRSSARRSIAARSSSETAFTSLVRPTMTFLRPRLRGRGQPVIGLTTVTPTPDQPRGVAHDQAHGGIEPP